MKHRIIAITFGLVALLLVVLWMTPRPTEHVGVLHEYRFLGLTIRDVSGRMFLTRDTVFIKDLAAAMDRTTGIPDVEPRMSRGYFECTFERESDLGVKVEVLCHIHLGPVLQENRSYAGPGMVNVIQLISHQFPGGKWCPDQAPFGRR